VAEGLEQLTNRRAAHSGPRRARDQYGQQYVAVRRRTTVRHRADLPYTDLHLRGL